MVSRLAAAVPDWPLPCRDMAAVIARLQASIAAKTAEAATEVAAEAEGVAEAAVAELEAIVEEEVGTRVPAPCVPSCCWWQTVLALKAVMGQSVPAFTGRMLSIPGKLTAAAV